jgi:diadenosine tetraphosphate (Ap4A) HIT family hydrolase
MKESFNDIPNVQERIIIQNNLAYAFPTNIPIVPGHVLVVPKRVVPTFEDMNLEEREAVFDLATKLKQALQRVFGATGFNEAWNEGESAGQAVAHFHLHIVPRKEGDAGITEYEPRKFLYRPGSREETPEAELSAVVELIKKSL